MCWWFIAAPSKVDVMLEFVVYMIAAQRGRHLVGYCLLKVPYEGRSHPHFHASQIPSISWNSEHIETFGGPRHCTEGYQAVFRQRIEVKSKHWFMRAKLIVLVLGDSPEFKYHWPHMLMRSASVSKLVKPPSWTNSAVQMLSSLIQLTAPPQTCLSCQLRLENSINYIIPFSPPYINSSSTINPQLK